MLTKIDPTDLKIALGSLGEFRSIAVTYRYAAGTPEGPNYLSDTASWVIGKMYEGFDPKKRITAIRNYFLNYPKEVDYMIKKMNEAQIIDDDTKSAF
jgi:hypothetical protein